MEWEDVLKVKRSVAEENEWRHRPANRYTDGGLALVSKVRTEGRDLDSVVREAVDLIGGVRRSLQPGDRVLLKANFNSPDPLPAATDPAFLAAVVRLLRDEGITDLTLGERSGWPSMPTAGVLEDLGIMALARELDLPVITFDDGPWMAVRVGKPARWWEKIVFPQALKQFNKIVFLPCLKHHRLAAFTMSLKLPVGMIHTRDLPYLHADLRGGKPHEPMYMKMIELSLPVGPDLILIDGRKAFVSHGPVTGEVVEPQLILASGDRIAIDVEGVKVLQSYPRENLLQGPVWRMPVILRAIELGLGVKGEDEYRVLSGS